MSVFSEMKNIIENSNIKVNLFSNRFITKHESVITKDCNTNFMNIISLFEKR